MILSNYYRRRLSKHARSYAYMAAYIMALLYFYKITTLSSDKVSDTKNVANYQDNHNKVDELAKVKGGRFGLNRIIGNEVPKYEIYRDEHELNYKKVGRLISVSSLTRNDYLRISGFEFCSILNNARFNPWVHICTFLES